MATKTRLIIEGDVVTRETEEGCSPDDVRVHRSRTKVQDWLNQLRAQEGQLEFLPPISCGHIVARQQKGQKSCVVVQLPPAIRSFYFSPDNRLYRVAMPFIVMAINFVGQAIDGTSSSNKCGVYWYYRTTSIRSLEDPLFFCNMPNVYWDGSVCWGTELIPLDIPLAAKVELVVQAIFASHFNQHELGEQWVPAIRMVRMHPQSFEEWETRSKEDPEFVLKLDWRPADGLTVRQALERGVK